jgi:hypothetical protein
MSYSNITVITIPVTILTHYERDDTEFNGNIVSVDIIVNGSLVQSYSSISGDNCAERVVGFKDGLACAYGQKNIYFSYAQRADGKF